MSNGRTRAWAWLAVALLGMVLVGLWSLRQEEAPPRAPRELEPAPGSPTASASSSAQPGSSSPSSTSPASPRTQRRGVRPITPEAERFRARVLDSLRSREEFLAGRPTSPSPATPASTPGTMKDRTGELGPEVMRVINHEFMPLVGECYEQARARDPRLRGMLALDIELAGTEEVGAIIETVDAAQDINELEDEELIECVRQSAFTIELPMPIRSGRMARQLTMPFGTPEDAGR